MRRIRAHQHPLGTATAIALSLALSLPSWGYPDIALKPRELSATAPFPRQALSARALTIRQAGSTTSWLWKVAGHLVKQNELAAKTELLDHPPDRPHAPSMISPALSSPAEPLPNPDDVKIADDLYTRSIYQKYIQPRIPFSFLYGLLRLRGTSPLLSHAMALRFRHAELYLTPVSFLAAQAIHLQGALYWGAFTFAVWTGLVVYLQRHSAKDVVGRLVREWAAVSVLLSLYTYITYSLGPLDRSAPIPANEAELIARASLLAGINILHWRLQRLSFLSGRLENTPQIFSHVLEFLSLRSIRKYPFELVSAATQVIAYHVASDPDRILHEKEIDQLLNVLKFGTFGFYDTATLTISLALAMSRDTRTHTKVIEAMLSDPARADVWSAVLGRLLQLPSSPLTTEDLNGWLAIPEFANHRAFITHVVVPLLSRRSDGQPPAWPEMSAMLFQNTQSGTGTSDMDRSKGMDQALAIRLWLRRPGAHVVIVHNIQDGLGDELIRNVGLMEGLLQANPDLQITIYTGRPDVYHHSRVKALEIRTEAFDKSLSYDLLIDHYENPERAYQPVVETQIAASLKYGAAHQSTPQFLIRYKLGFTNTYCGLNPYAGGKNVPLAHGTSVYGETHQLCAFLGVPFPYGEDLHSESVLLGPGDRQAWPYWKAEIESRNPDRRPVMIYNGFGGTYKEKGLQFIFSHTHVIEKIIDRGYFVVVLPNHQAWGTPERAQQIIEALGPAYRTHAFAPRMNHSEKGWFAKLVNQADFIVTVEGGLVHLAYALGKPFATLFTADSGDSLIWHPQTPSLRQFVIRTDWGTPVESSLPSADSLRNSHRLTGLSRAA